MTAAQRYEKFKNMHKWFFFLKCLKKKKLMEISKIFKRLFKLTNKNEYQ